MVTTTKAGVKTIGKVLIRTEKVGSQTLVDHQGKPWSLDERLCKGGFGTIYSCTENDKVVVKTQHRSDDQLRKEERFYRDLQRLDTTEAPKYIPDLVSSV